MPRRQLELKHRAVDADREARRLRAMRIHEVKHQPVVAGSNLGHVKRNLEGMRAAASPCVTRPGVDPRPVLPGVALPDDEAGIVRKGLRIGLVIPRQRKFMVVPVGHADLKHRHCGRRRLVLGRG